LHEDPSGRRWQILSEPHVPVEHDLVLAQYSAALQVGDLGRMSEYGASRASVNRGGVHQVSRDLDGARGLRGGGRLSYLYAATLVRLLWKRRDLPAWQHVLSILLIGAAGLGAILAGRDCATKVARVQVRTEPPELSFERRLPRRSRTLRPGELRGVGLVTLGTTLDDEEGGQRQLLLSIECEREIRSFLENDPAKALVLGERIAEVMGLELQRFAGPPPLKHEANRP
jgi:hypothetical protein